MSDPSSETSSRRPGLLRPARHGRFEYSAIADRPVWDWPGGERLAFYVALNLETFGFGHGHGAQLGGGGDPDILNHGWREHGNRVGAWRLLEMLERLELPCTVLANSLLYEEAPGLIEAFRARGDDIVAHARTNAERQDEMDEATERALIAETTRTFTEHEGVHPRGWLGPWIAERPDTPELLVEAGYRYTLDWCHDDQPTWLETRAGRLLAVPYPQELNDVPQIVNRKLEAPAFATMVSDTFDFMHAECARRPLVMGVAIHPYLMGYPHRLVHLERALRHVIERSDALVWKTTASAIDAHYRTVDV